MSKDAYAFNPIWLSPELDFGSNQNIYESVHVSQLQPYLAATFGEDVPGSRSDRFMADTFFNAATAFSTDETLSDIICDERLSAYDRVRKYIPRLLQLAEPLIDVTKSLDKSAAKHLSKYADGEIPNMFDDDMSYMVGLAWHGTQISSIALDITHPSNTNPQLARYALDRGKKLIGGNTENPEPLTMFLGTTVPKPEHVRKVNKLRADTARLNDRLVETTNRWIAIMQGAQAKIELRRILSNPGAAE